MNTLTLGKTGGRLVSLPAGCRTLVIRQGPDLGLPGCGIQGRLELRMTGCPGQSDGYDQAGQPFSIHYEKAFAPFFRFQSLHCVHEMTNTSSGKDGNGYP